MGTFTSYVLIVVGLSIALYLVGYESPFLELVDNLGTEDTVLTGFSQSILGLLTNPIFLLGIGITAISSFLTTSGYGSASFLGAIMLVYFALNYFVLPTSFLFDMNLPLTLRAVFFVILNTISLLGGLEFVRGGQI